MTTFSFWHRGRRAATVVACGSLFLGACDVNKELLQPEQPGVISPSAVVTATAADALWAGALGPGVDDAGDDGTNDLLVSDVIRLNELQTWFVAEHVVDEPLVYATR